MRGQGSRFALQICNSKLTVLWRSPMNENVESINVGQIGIARTPLLPPLKPMRTKRGHGPVAPDALAVQSGSKQWRATMLRNVLARSPRCANTPPKHGENCKQSPPKRVCRLVRHDSKDDADDDANQRHKVPDAHIDAPHLAFKDAIKAAVMSACNWLRRSGEVSRDATDTGRRGPLRKAASTSRHHRPTRDCRSGIQPAARRDCRSRSKAFCSDGNAPPCRCRSLARRVLKEKARIHSITTFQNPAGGTAGFSNVQNSTSTQGTGENVLPNSR